MSVDSNHFSDNVKSIQFFEDEHYENEVLSKQQLEFEELQLIHLKTMSKGKTAEDPFFAVVSKKLKSKRDSTIKK